MHEARPVQRNWLRQAVFPLLIAVVLVVGALLVCGSSLIRIEDVYINRILAGTYGVPDWRVQEMNPLLAQFLTLLYRLIPSVNWYGVLLLALVWLSSACVISLAARKRGGLIPVAIVISPIAVLLTHSLQSSVVAALCVVAGVFSLMEGVRRKGEGRARLITGILLFVVGAMFSLPLACVLTLGAILCWLPSCVRDKRVKSLAVGVPVMAVLLAALFGYSSLMYASPELSAYRSQYQRYDQLQHSNLVDEYDDLLAHYGVSLLSPSHEDHDHAEEEAHEETPETAGTFALAGWSLNDVDLFFGRFASDTALLEPASLETLAAETDYISTDMGRLFQSLLDTVQKPQFLLLIALLILTALATLLTSRRRGLVALLAALIAFGGHIVLLMCHYDAFSAIAPFYLLGILVLIYHFDGESALEWTHNLLRSRKLRTGVSAAVLVCFLACLGGFSYYLYANPANTEYAEGVYTYLTTYVRDHPDMLFIGDNPNDRYKPDTLAVPQRGADENLLAGSYDLYSPRAAAQMERFGITNPLADCVDREDIGYINMAFYQPMAYRLFEAYGVNVNLEPLLEDPLLYGEAIYAIRSYSSEEYDAALAEQEAQEALEAEAMQALEEILEEAAHAAEEGTGEEAAGGEDASSTAAPVESEPSPEAEPTDAGDA